MIWQVFGAVVAVVVFGAYAFVLGYWTGKRAALDTRPFPPEPDCFAQITKDASDEEGKP